ncbi:hypothetical protein JHK82_043524 [Glycine max]|nr:hypothetical protein JHK82_043524 [Glycine max]
MASSLWSQLHCVDLVAPTNMRWVTHFIHPLLLEKDEGLDANNEGFRGRRGCIWCRLGARGKGGIGLGFKVEESVDGGMGSDFGVEGEGVGGGVKVFGSFFEGVENTVLIYENENVQYKEKGGWDENLCNSNQAKPILSLGRTEKFPPPLMRFLRSNVASRSSRRYKSSPMFRRKKNSTTIETQTQEPSSPKVMCMGQVRVKCPSKQGTTTKRDLAPTCCRCYCCWIQSPNNHPCRYKPLWSN